MNFWRRTGLTGWECILVLLSNWLQAVSDAASEVVLIFAIFCLMIWILAEISLWRGWSWSTLPSFTFFFGSPQRVSFSYIMAEAGRDKLPIFGGTNSAWKRLLQDAADGKIRFWGIKGSRGPLGPIPPAYWLDYEPGGLMSAAVHAFYEQNPDTHEPGEENDDATLDAHKIGDQRIVGYKDLHVSLSDAKRWLSRERKNAESQARKSKRRSR